MYAHSGFTFRLEFGFQLSTFYFQREELASEILATLDFVSAYSSWQCLEVPR